MVLHYAFIQVIPHDYLITKDGLDGLYFESPLLPVATLIGLVYIYVLIIIDSIVRPYATGYSYLGTSSRMLYEISAKRECQRYFAKIKKQVNISRSSIYCNFCICLG
ncbi:APC family permease, partial [Francisella tularensis]|nr:APC family permease [Francisella tularensis]